MVESNFDQMMSIVIVGHVDHGKSTIIGRLLADTGTLPKGKLEQVKESCERNSKPFEYAFLIDALKDERSQGITINSARVFFKSDKRHYLINDAPGHIEFLKNTGHRRIAFRGCLNRNRCPGWHSRKFFTPRLPALDARD